MLIAVAWVVTGCASIATEPSVPTAGHAASGEPSEISSENPRITASLSLTNQGRMMLEQGNAEGAIGIFEQALAVYPANGETCYYLSEAWLEKGDLRQAREFNRLAGMYLEDSRGWRDRLKAQYERIMETAGN